MDESQILDHEGDRPGISEDQLKQQRKKHLIINGVLFVPNVILMTMLYNFLGTANSWFIGFVGYTFLCAVVGAFFGLLGSLIPDRGLEFSDRFLRAVLLVNIVFQGLWLLVLIFANIGLSMMPDQ